MKFSGLVMLLVVWSCGGSLSQGYYESHISKKPYYDGRFSKTGGSHMHRTIRSGSTDERRPTKSLKEIFIGRCLYFGNVMYTNLDEYTPKNCTEMWEAFHGSYSGHVECETPEGNYYKFAELAYNNVKENKSAFWEGLQVFMEEFSENGRRFVGISDTFTGYVLNNCAWCGTTNDDKNESSKVSGCKDACDSCKFTWAPNCTEHSFWAAVSRQYARNATGRVSLFLNAARSSVYSKQGLFTTHELPELNYPKNTHVDVRLVLPSLGTVPAETCGTGSLLELETLIKSKNLTMTCTHYPLDVRHFKCVDDTEAMECRLYYDPDCLMTISRGQEDKCAYRNSGTHTSCITTLIYSILILVFLVNIYYMTNLVRY